MRGGVDASDLEKIQTNLQNISSQVNDTLQEINAMKSSSSSNSNDDDFYGLESSMSKPEETTTSTTSATSDLMSDYGSVEPVAPKPWQDDKNTKFNDGTGGRVSLSFPRIMMLIQSNITKGNTSKNWSSIKEQLLDATSIGQVKSVISQNKLNFSANSVYGGTRKKRKGGRRRKTNKRR